MIESIPPSRYLMFILATTIYMLFCLNSSPVQARLVEKVVAVVNGEVITQTELAKEGKNIFNQIRQNTPASELDEALSKARHQVLTDLIEDLLVAQKAKELRINVTEQDLDSTIAKISQDNNLTVEQLYLELEKTGSSKEEYRHKLASQIRSSRLINYEVQSKIVISEEKAHAYYDTVFSKQETAKGYHLLQIGLTWGTPGSSSATKDKAKTRAEGIRNLAMAGQDFRELARSFSELPSAKDGGDLGFFAEDEMADYMKESIIGLNPGQTSALIETSDSYQFYRLITKNIDGTPNFAPFADVSAEIMEQLRREELDKRYKKWLHEIKAQAIIKELL
ncbi:MAG: SurA N-terminal domain-containing protein [Thermodesulfobacteriota bacterium]